MALFGHPAMSGLSLLWGVKRKSDIGAVRSESDPGCVKTPTLKLRVEFPSRFRRCGKPIALATSVRRRQLRKQFCAYLAQASFHTAWVKTGKAQCEQMFSALPLRADIAQCSRHVRFVP